MATSLILLPLVTFTATHTADDGSTRAVTVVCLADECAVPGSSGGSVEMPGEDVADVGPDGRFYYPFVL